VHCLVVQAADTPIKTRIRAGRCGQRVQERVSMKLESEVLRVLDEVLSLAGRSSGFTRATHLLGAIPELDSMAVVSLITALEERFSIVVDDDDIDGDTFASVGTLVDFVSAKTAA
jgi:acyl carrier protein